VNTKTKLLILGVVLLAAAIFNIADPFNLPEDARDQIWRVINFIIFLTLLYYAGGYKLFEFFPSRSKEIETELRDLGSRKKEAEQQLENVQKSIANLEQERAQILEQAKAQGENLKKQIIAKAEAQAAQIKEQAQVSAQQEAKQALQEIRAELADKVAEATEAMIKKKLKAEDHKTLINDSLTRVVLN